MTSQSQEVVNPYDDASSLLLPGLMVKGPWTDQLTTYVRERDVRALYFNSARGWRGSDFSFLASVPEVEEVDIITARVDNLQAVQKLSGLRRLSVNGVVEDEVDFTNLERLKCCYLSWWPGAESILTAPALANAYFDALALRDWQLLANLTAVRTLTIANSAIPYLDWLDELELRELHLLNCRKLEDFSPISRQASLERLTISGSKRLYDLEFLSGLESLQFLSLSDSHTFRSLTPLTNLREFAPSLLRAAGPMSKTVT